ncbi:MAG: hypothetical protein WC624_03110 [Candidatus Margulisiibacteriota bacterium]
MKFQITLYALLITIFLVSASYAGNVTVSGRAGLYNSGNGSTSMMYGVGADYQITPNLSARAAVETTSYDQNGTNVTYMPITADLIYGQTFLDMITPYVGAGLSYNSTTALGKTTSTTGYQGETGIKVAVGGFSAGVEFRYMVPDASKSYNTSSTNAYVTGSFSQSFNI